MSCNLDYILHAVAIINKGSVFKKSAGFWRFIDEWRRLSTCHNLVCDVHSAV